MTTKSGLFTVNNPEDMPKAHHYVILEFTEVHFGDEMIEPRAHPPADPAPGEPWVPVVRYKYTTNHDIWRDEITRKTINKDRFVAFKASPPAEIVLKAEVRCKQP